MAKKTKNYPFQAAVSEVLGLVINSLYSNKEIFLRELVSNASDALDKLRFRAVTDASLLGDRTLHIQIIPDADAGTLVIRDNGVGMTEEELVQNLGTIAHSGSKAFLEKLAAQQKQKEQQDQKEQDVSLIGQFGVGFYSAYLVADRVEVVTRAAGHKKALLWSSDGKEGFTIGSAKRDESGTEICLFLKEDARQYLEEHTLRELIKRYSDFVAHPIELQVLREVPTPKEAPTEKTDAEENADKELRFEQVNSGNALWRQRSSEVKEEQYAEFYRHLTHDYQDPRAYKHFHIEGTQLFSGLLYIPQRPPFDLFSPEAKHGVRLHVKRVFIMDDCEELLPKWLRFIKGVIDSEDLPLNVSRETLQDSRIVRIIRKQVVKKTLDMLEELAGKKEDYIAFWEQFGPVLKEGLHFEPAHKERIAKLTRWQSTASDGLTTLDAYIERMKENQDVIYYIAGASRAMVENTPHLEGLKKHGFEVLLLTDGIDPWAVEGLGEYKEKKLVSVMDASLHLDSEDDEDNDNDKNKKEQPDLSALLAHFQTTLSEDIAEVRISKRLTDSAACLVMPEGGLPPYMERLLRMQQSDMPKQKRVLELNPDHTVIQSLAAILAQNPESTQLTEWLETVYDQALLAEGSPIENPNRFVRRIDALLTEVTRQAAV